MKKLTKKIYTKPLLEVIDVDHEISLVMFSVENPPGLSAPTSDPTPSRIGADSAESNPFGGDAPDYSN